MNRGSDKMLVKVIVRIMQNGNIILRDHQAHNEKDVKKKLFTLEGVTQYLILQPNE